jgi:hypothetical protein
VPRHRMRNYESSGIMPESFFHDDARMNRSTIERAAKQFLAGNDVMTFREVDRREHLLFHLAEAKCKVIACRPGTRQDRPSAHALR